MTITKSETYKVGYSGQCAYSLSLRQRGVGAAAGSSSSRRRRRTGTAVTLAAMLVDDVLYVFWGGGRERAG